MKRNLILLLVEELPTLQRLQIQKPHVYQSSWLCCRCQLEEESFSHLWLCPKARSALELIKDMAISTLDTLVSAHLSPQQMLGTDLSHFSFWIIPNSLSHSPSSTLF